MNTENRKKAYRLGLSAERRARWLLMLKGYRIVAERYRNPFGEIDIVACKRDTLVAVEVKARRSFSECEESVTPMKQQRIARAVEGLLAQGTKITGRGGCKPRNIRFDVIWVVPGRWPKHIRDAWRL